MMGPMLSKHPASLTVYHSKLHFCGFICIWGYSLSHTGVLFKDSIQYLSQQVNLPFCTFSLCISSRFLSMVMHFFSISFNSDSAPFSLSHLAGLSIVGNEDWHRYSKINCFLVLLLNTHTQKSKH